jgi:hypothetical protein
MQIRCPARVNRRPVGSVVAHLASVAATPQLLLQLADCAIEGGAEVGPAALGVHGGAGPPASACTVGPAPRPMIVTRWDVLDWRGFNSWSNSTSYRVTLLL